MSKLPRPLTHLRASAALLAALAVVLTPAFALADEPDAFTKALQRGPIFAGFAALLGGLLTAATPCVYIDFAGNAALRRRVHEHFQALRYSCSVGGAHVTELGGAKDLPGPRATLFFAPAQSKKRSTEWGRAVLAERMVGAWQGFLAAAQSHGWVQPAQAQGPAAAQAAYAQVLGGRMDPRVGQMVSLAGG